MKYSIDSIATVGNMNLVLLSVVVAYFNVVSGEVYYITPSPNDLCAKKSCLTLSQFAANSSVHLNSNTTLLFASGDHFLETEILIKNANKVSMLANFTNTVSGTTITCDQYYVWFSYDSVATLIISGLTFVHCGHQMNSVETFMLKDCTFLNHSGTVIMLSKSVAYVSNSSFISNSGGTFEFHSIGYRLDSSYAGAVVKMLESNIIIDTGMFKWNNAEIGAVIFCKINSNVTFKNSTFLENVASKAGSIVYSDSGCMVVVHSCIFKNNSASNKGGVFEIFHGALFVEQSTFLYNNANQGGVINAGNGIIKSSIAINGSSFIDNTASFAGGAVTAVNVLVIICGHTEFFNNRAKFGGGAVYINLGLVTIIDSNFINNTASSFGGGVFLLKTEVTISSTAITGNTAEVGGGLALVEVSGNINKFEISKNIAVMEGGAIRGEKCSIIIKDIVFKENSAHSGGMLFMSENSSITTIDIVIENNTASQGVVYFTECSVIFTHNTSISGNIGSLILYYSGATFRDNASITFNSPPQETNLTISQGGAITAFQSSIRFEGKVKLMYNIADNGGGIHAILSKLHILSNSDILLSNNTAMKSGGGIYLYQSELNCRSMSDLKLWRNSAMVNGGGIHAISSTITAIYDTLSTFSTTPSYSGSRIRFVSNDAMSDGGGIYLENDAKLIVFSKSDGDKAYYYTIIFDGNTADYGGAVYVADDTISGTCVSTSFETSSTTTECFLQTLELRPLFASRVQSPNYVNTKFINNHALFRGSDLFGGLLDRCTESTFNKKTKTGLSVVGFNYFTVFSNLNSTETISSDPVQVCFCDDDELNCNYQPPPIEIKKGEPFTVPLAAVDQVGHVISAIIYSHPIKSNESGIGEGQFIQSTASNNTCTTLTFNVFSPYEDEELIVFAGGPCKDAPLSQRRIQIKFLPCTCPIGFEYKVQVETRCVCECDSKLEGYVRECKLETQTLVRHGQSWISYVQTVPGNFSDYLIYPYCPLNYCKDNAELNLNAPNGADGQCASFRTGTLCGACQSRYSLSLGSTHCLKCPSYWPAIFVFILVASFLAGLALVALILVLNLTVAVGTLNGIIFYANVVYANIHTFHPDSRSSFATVFVSWLNLDIGIDTCFIKGMNAYWKTWLQLIFPSYVFFLVLMVIIISNRSRRFSELIGKKNPVATLATLVLLSYTKLLHIIITAFSSATLNYPGPSGGYKRKVWLSDATVDYLKGKHVPLFLAAVLILFAGIVYTTLIFSWQWLQQFNKGKILKWTRNPKVSGFVEIYHTPYTPQNRYWTGLLLFVRVILYIASTANVSGDPKINLLTLGSVITGVLLVNKIVGIGNRVYKRWPIEVLEVASYMNLLLLSLGSFFSLENTGRRKAVTNVSVSITFLLLLGVLFYHVFTELIVKRWKKANREIQSSLEQAEGVSDPGESFQVSATTSSVVEAPKKILCTNYSELREALLDYSDD